MSLRALRTACGLLALVPVVTGVLTMMGVSDPLYAQAGLPRDALLDSNLRFFGGMWLVAGLAMLWLLPRSTGRPPSSGPCG